MPQNPQSDPASLQRMHDVVGPEPIAWWPLAPGWYALILFCIACVVVGLVVLVLRWYRNRYRRIAIQQLNQLRAKLDDQTGRGMVLADLSQLVKRTLLAAWPRDQVASLSGESLLHFLDQTGNTRDFAKGAGKVLATAAYRTTTESEMTSTQTDELFRAVGNWIRGHSIERGMPSGGGNE